MGWNTAGATFSRIYRIGSDFSVQDLGLPTDLPAGTAFDIGEFDGNDHYRLTTGAASTTVCEIDQAVVADGLPRREFALP